MRSTLGVILLVSLLFGCTPQPGEVADLVLLDGKIVTLDEVTPTAEALAVRGDRIIAVGSSAEIRVLVGDATQVIDLEGRLAIPGFIEGHGHFLSLGRSLSELDLSSSRSWDEIVSQVEAAVARTPSGAWIFGRGWHQSKWEVSASPSVAGLPYHDGLSAVSPENPVLLTHSSGHAVLANERAMQLSGIDFDSTAPVGGEIVRDPAGRLIGVFRENAMALLRPSVKESWNEEASRLWVDLATEECLSHGITSFQDAGSSLQAIDFFKRLALEGELGVRLWVMIRASNDALAASLRDVRTVDLAGGFLTVRAIKKSIDGALGTHGAWLLEPYNDVPSTAGMATTSLDNLRATARLAAEHDFQLCVHAIGDRGNRETLNIFEESYATEPNRDWRWRVEHAQHLDQDDIGRFSELGVIASMQGVHCTSDGPWVPSRLGSERSRLGAYVWRDLLDSGAIVINGTDTPVERVDPLPSYYASVTRRLDDGTEFYPEQVMTRMEALRSYTADAAFAAFEEGEKGSLRVGKLADIVVLSKDILAVEAEEILDAEVLYTIVGGRVLYQRRVEGSGGTR